MYQTAARNSRGHVAERPHAAIEELRREEATFWRAVTHELRAPLQAILGFAELLGPDLPPGKLARYRDHLARQAGRLADEIEELHQLAELEGDALGLVPMAVEVEALLLDAASVCQERAPDCAVDVAWPDDLPLTWADPLRARQALDDLLRNAVRRSSGRGRIDLVARARDGRVQLLVCDEGPAVPADLREAVFDRCVKAAQLGSDDGPGWGLGRYVARQLARRMGGDVVVEPLPGGRVAFVLALPAAPG